MADYGVKVSKRDTSVLQATGADILLSTRFPFAKIDPTKTDTFRSTTVTFLRNSPDNTKTLIAQFAHGYDYRPQVWGLWNVTWSSSLGGLTQNGYGALTNTAGFPSTTLSYEWDETNVYLYIEKGGSTDTIGTIATLTTYIFVDDLENQSY